VCVCVCVCTSLLLQACGGIVVSACQEYISDVKRDCVVAILEVC